ncbi:autotransporter outer membrane beta-barrel domain-containing protein [Nitratireductor sp. XY-223]|uniref:autotransporter outer membrane beta-barrel domain-containing protein n=1 Tax=Nitratireductor sp. XY-223 TaxID=2561926 RepID=UPI0010AB061B|nr:autotransporter outer membrane beta-barrel domain-containing protein [Nitratireductor sp. XY-223]
MAADVTVPDGTTETITQRITDDGDTLTVENGGAIDASYHAVFATADNQTVINDGTIASTGHDGIHSIGDNITIINGSTGTISGGDDVIEIQGVNAHVINYGLLQSDYGIYVNGSNANAGDNTEITNADGATITSVMYGVYVFGSDEVKITNTGGATIKGGAFEGIYLHLSNDAMITNADGATIEGVRYGIWAYNSNNATIINTGGATIEGGEEGIGINKSNNATITNAGGATIKGVNTGVIVRGSLDTKIVNNGTVTGNINGITITTDGFGNASAGAVITNRGTIVGGDHAIRIDSTSTNISVNLLAGSVIDGGVLFDGPNLRLNIGEGLNLYLDYDGTIETLTSVFPIIHDETNGIVYTVDPSYFELSQAFIQTTADAVHQAVRDGAGRGNRFGGGFSGNGTFAYGMEPPGFDNTGPRGWVSGFGGFQKQGARQAYGGLVTGGGFASGDRMYGAFLGGAYSQLKNALTTDALSYYGGLYGGMSTGPFWIEAAFLGGHTDFSYERTVANNMVAGGLETVSADYDGTFISPSFTIGRSLGDRLEVSVGGNYAGLFIDGYTESGMAGMTVASRDVHVAAVRAEARYLAEQRKLHNGIMSVETWAGVDGFFNLGGDDVEISIAGLPFEAIPVNVTDATVVGFAGIGLNHDYGKWSLRTSVEGRYGSDAYREIRSNASVAVTF